MVQIPRCARDDLKFLHLQRPLQRLPPSPRHPQTNTVVEHDGTAPIRLAVQLAHSPQIHNQRTMNANEVAGLEQALEGVHALRDEVRLLPGVNASVVAECLDPVDVLDVDDECFRTGANAKPARR